MKRRFAILGLLISLLVPAMCQADPRFDLTNYVEYLESKNYDDYRLEALESLKKNSPRLSVEDVKAILKVFSSDDKRKQAALLLYPYVTNQHNWFKVEESFTYSSTWKSLQASIDALPESERMHHDRNPRMRDRNRGPRGGQRGNRGDRGNYSNINVDANSFIHETSSGERQIDEAEYSGYLQNLRSDEQRIQALRKLMSVNPALYVVDLQSILATLTDDAERVKAATILYRFVKNKSNWFKLKDYFDDAKNWETVTESTVAHPIARMANANDDADSRRVRQVDEVGFVQYLRMMSSDNKRFKAVQQLANVDPAIYVSDIKAIMEVFSRTADQRKAAEMLYPYLVNVDNWYEITNILSAKEMEDEQLYMANPQAAFDDAMANEASVNSQTDAAAAVSAMAPFIQTLASKSADTERIALIQNFVVMGLQIQVSDVKGMLETFMLESYRMKAAELLYPNVSDKAQWDTLATLFTSPDQWEIVKLAIVNKPAALVEPMPTGAAVPVAAPIATPPAVAVVPVATTPAVAVAQVPAAINNDIPALVEALKAQIFDIKRKTVIAEFLKTAPKLTVANVAQILKTFANDDEKIQPALDMYPYIIDKNNWSSLAVSFESNANWIKVQNGIVPAF